MLNTFYKILAMVLVLKNRIEVALEDRLMSTQFGFRKDKSTTQAMDVARRVQEFAERAGLPGTMIFLVREEAFDKVNHKQLIRVLESYQLPSKIVSIIK